MPTSVETVATRRRLDNIKRVLTLLTGQEMTVDMLVDEMQLSRSAIRDYVDTSIEHSAVRVVRYTGELRRKQYIVTAVSQEAIDRMVASLTRAPSSGRRERHKGEYDNRPSSRERRIAEALKDGRHIVNNGDPIDYLKIPPALPAFRCEFEAFFFGPAKAAA